MPAPRIAAGLALLAVSAGLAGCAGPERSSSGVLVGQALPATGGLARPGEIMALAVGRALDQVNAAGGVAGAPLLLVRQDTASDAARAGSAAQALVAAGVVAIVGDVASGHTKAVLQVAEAARVPVLSPGSTSPEFTALMAAKAEQDRFFFRTAPSDALRGRVTAAYAVARGWDRVAVLYDNNPYGNGLKPAFAAAFEAAGGNVTAVAFEEGRASYADALRRALAGCDGATNATCPDGVFFIGYPDAALQVGKDWSARPEWASLPWLFSDSEQGFYDQLRAANVSIAGFEAVQPQGEGPGFAAYQALAGDAPPFSGNAYDATVLVALAAEASKGAGGEALRDALRGVANPPGERVGPADIARALELARSGEDIDYEGAAGSMNLDALGDVTSAYVVFRIDAQGKLREKCLILEAAVVAQPVRIPAACTAAPH
ncbi:MAG TPA: ABC transporter substrate-binding protein [Candidatus Thermoplasmatota archaeon]|jgi:ABC-type branched-subunit amino acid transport system substrate-binding protein|nr:ABC transporter substrate-binding protein [Candidatus Thermoplasmatota archaeon]